MKKDIYQNMLLAAYELEGLLLLAMSRDEVNEKLERLIEEKTALLAETLCPHGVKEQVEQPEKVAGERADEEDDNDARYYAIEEPEEETKDVAPAGESESPLRKKPVFSLNDKFLFMRELFEGDGGEFNHALQRLTYFKNYDEAEKFLLEKYKWNPEEEAVASFLEIIRTWIK